MYLLLIAATSLFCGATLAVDIPVDEDGLLVLNNVIYDDAIRQYDYVCVLFYVPGGNSSDELLKNFVEAVPRLNTLAKVKMAKMDATIPQHHDIVQRYMIETFPRVHLFKKNPLEARCTCVGVQTTDQIVGFVNLGTSPAIKMGTGCGCFGGNLPRD